MKISWDEALDATAAAMRRLAATHGPQSVAFSQCLPPRRRPFLHRLMKAFGAPHVRLGPRGYATRYAYGVASVATGSENSACLILRQLIAQREVSRPVATSSRSKWVVGIPHLAG